MHYLDKNLESSESESEKPYDSESEEENGSDSFRRNDDEQKTGRGQ